MPVSVERFIQALTSTGIMTATEAETLAQSVAAERRTGDADELARDLVRQGKLTRFQAAAIYQEKADGLLLGNYLILDKLGAGGMGQVFRARHRRMDRVVALKVLSKKLLDSPDAVARFQREAKAAARLTHPNIVTAHDADEAGGMHFLVMEYVEGGDLSDLVKQQGPLPVQQAVDFMLQAARGLEHAHAEGVIHRDIKPSNLLLDKRGTVKILDMGLARFSDPLAGPNATPGADLTHSGSIMGTIDYMAPEQAMDSRQADAKSDIYSLGCALHYLLTGRPPYGGDTIMKRLTAHQQAAIPALSALRPDVPAGLQEVFGRMMAKRPAARYQTMQEVVAALGSCLTPSASASPIALTAPVTPLAPAASIASSGSGSGIKDLASVMLPGAERERLKPRKSNSKTPLIVAATVMLLVAAAAIVWLRPGANTEQLAEAPGETPSAVSTPTVSVALKKVIPSLDPQAKPATPEPAQSAPIPAATPTAVESSIAPTPIPMPDKLPARTFPTVAEVASAEAAPPQEPAADARLPIPPAEAQQQAAKLIQDVFKDDYAQAKQADGKLALAEKLLGEAEKTQDDSTARYVMLREACDLASDAASPALVDRVISTLAGLYSIEPLRERTVALERMAARPHPAAANKPIADAALARIDEALGAAEFDLARRLAEVATSAARKARDTALSKQALEVVKAVAAAKQQWESAQTAEATLAKNPDDPAANLAMGGYLCFAQGDWNRGFECLAKSNEATLKELAAKSLAASDNPAARVDLGDAWWDAAEKAKGKPRDDLRAGAGYWYGLAVEGMTGLAKTRVEKRLAEIGGSGATPNRSAAAASAKKLPAGARRAVEPPVPGAVAAGGRFYKVFMEKLSWTDAKAKCEDMGGSLICIGSSEENEFIINLIEAQIGQGLLGTTDKKFWLGGHLQDGQWTWISGEPFNYAPNKISTNPDKPCLRHAGANWLAISDRTSLIAGYVCEWNPADRGSAPKSPSKTAPAAK